DKDPEIVSTVRKMMVRKFKQEHLDKHLHRQSITEQEAINYYQNHREGFTAPAMARAAVLSMKFNPEDDETAKTTKRKRAEEARNKAIRQSGTTRNFGRLAREYSDDSRTRYRGGVMNWIAEGTKHYRWDPKVVDAVFALEKPGDVSRIVETSKGLFLVKLIDRRPEKTEDYKLVKRRIQEKLIAEKKKRWLEKYYREARTATRITIDRERLKSIPSGEKFAKSNSKPPLFPTEK
ncbi:MAG: hypothetical protein GY866_32065, partial [Proteobacteria bacterium]|nr:hypothetical protein [Pseudomonadota bacterium]